MIKRLARITVSIFLPIAAAATVACDRHDGATEKMDLAESLMKTRPDSALSVLDSIKTENLGEKDEARYALLKSMALDKNYIDTTSFDVIQPAIDYFLKEGSDDEKLRTYYYQGRIYQNRKNNDSAMQSFMLGRECFAHASDTLTMANLLVAQGTILHPMYKFDEYIRINLEASRLYNAIGRKDYEMSCLVNALDGGIVTDNRHLADSIMAVAKKLAVENEELSSLFSPYILSYVLNFGNKEDITNIVNYYDSIPDLDDEFRLDLVEAYSKIGDSSKALRILNSIPSTSEKGASPKYLAIKPDILEKNGDYAGALEAYRDFSATLDSIHLDMFSTDILFAKQRHEMEKSNLLMLQKRDRFIWAALCVTFVLLIIAVYIYYRYRLSKTKALLKEQENTRLQLEQENLQLKIEQLENESASLKEILEKQKDLDSPVAEAIKIRIEMLHALLANEITGNESLAKPYGAWRDRLIHDRDTFMNTTRLAIKATHPRFMEYLEEQKLTESEINYVCLYAIGFRGKEVGSYLHTTRHYHINSEIRKKLGIDSHETNINIYIRQLMDKL